jgi:hypothetical protein
VPPVAAALKRPSATAEGVEIKVEVATNDRSIVG